MTTNPTVPDAIRATGLSRTYGRGRRAKNALADCSFRIPQGAVCALVGPNGSGKSTLLTTAAGLVRPTSGTLAVLGAEAGVHRDRVGYLDQRKPLYDHLTVAETLALGADLNPGRWDAGYAAGVVEQGGLDPAARVRSLSGGQHTRVALALVLGKRPDLLLLDEPMADLDPLARHELLGTLLADAAERGTTILLSSHIVAELVDSCDYLVLLGEGVVRLAGPIDDLLEAHAVVTAREPDLSPHTVVESRPMGHGVRALVRPAGPLPDDWHHDRPTLEELVLAHLRAPSVPPLPTAVGTADRDCAEPLKESR
ncbi:ABC transporter ATP-binding protein [Streptomyces sp. NPDC090306]|uniref:ABC transporter ATP-binding protein n=1 Tax=Streptomyces sp. NPDC090306 TaxID=3365961 RepID=UPI00381B22D8